MAFIFGGDTGETQSSIDAKRKLAAALIQQGGQSTPIQSPWQGVARLSESLMGGLALRKQAQDEQAANAQVMAAITGQPYTPPAQSPGLFGSLFGGGKGVPASSGAQGEVAATTPAPNATGAPDTSGLDGNQIYGGFMDTVKGGVQNPYALAAIASTGKAESGFSPKMMNASWSDPSGSGQPGTAGGLMSWRNERLANLRNYAQANGEDPGNISPQMQGKFFLQENPQLITALNGAKSVGEAQQLMNNAWAFRGYNVPGNSQSASRLATAQALLPSFQQASAPAGTPAVAAASMAPPVSVPVSAQAPTSQPTQVASLDPSAAMSQLGDNTPYSPKTDEQRAAEQARLAPIAAQLGDNTPRAALPVSIPPKLSQTVPGYIDPQVTTAFQAPQAQTPAAQAIQQQAPIPSQTQTASLGNDNGAQIAPGVPSPQAAIPVPTPAPFTGAPLGAVPAASAAVAPQAPPAQRLAQALQSSPAAPSQTGPLAGNPRAQALMAAMMNPYASQQAKSLAGALLQQQMAPQYDMVTRPDGSIVAVNKINPANSMQVQGPMKTDSIVDGPADPQTGLPTKLIWNAVDGVKGRLGSDGSVQPAGNLAGGGAQPQQTVQGNPIPQGVDPKKYREEMAARAATQASPSAEDEEKFVNGMMERPSYKEYSAAVPTWNSFTQHIQDNSPAADKAIVDDFAKILNPGRAVTTGSFQLNMDAQSIPEYLQGQILKAFSGNGELGPDARAQMAKIAQLKVQQYQGAWQLDADQGSKVAKAHNLNVENVIPQLPNISDIDFSKINSVKTTANGTAAAPAAAGQPAPAASMPTASGPNGQKIQWNGSAWVPVSSGALGADPNSNATGVPTGWN